MKVPLRKQKREQMLSQLESNGFNVQLDEGNDLAILDSRGNKTRLIFDEKFIPQKIVKPSGLEYGFTFDSKDQLVKFSFPGNESISFDYQDELLTAILLNDGRIGLNYDEKKRITEVISQDNKGHKISYNQIGQVEDITNRANETRKYQTFIKGNHLVHVMKDSLGRVTMLETDPTGDEGDKIRFPDGTKQTSHYDEILDAIVTTLRSGAKVFTYYDGLNPKRVEWEDGNFQNLELDGEQVNSIENPSGTLHFEYDEKGRVLIEEFQGNRLAYKYDEDGNLIEMVYPTGLVVRYGYDEDGRLNAITTDQAICTYEYTNNDTISTVRYGNGMVEHRKEKVLGGLQSCQLTDPNGVIQSQQDYQYDKVNRLSRYHDMDQSRTHVHKDLQLRYDEEGRLRSALDSVSGKQESFAYDTKGNLNSANGQPITVGLMDEVLTIDGFGVQYDGNGNVRSFVDASGRTVNLTFNDNNELKFASIGNDTWEYWYDGLGRRVGKSNGKEAFKFFWGSEKLLSEEVKTIEGTCIREYIYGTNANVPMAYCEDGKLFWLQSDVRGAVTKVFDIFAHAVWSADYTAFGEAIPYVKGVRQAWRLTGQYHDAETGLHYSYVRYYSTHLKTFLSLDRFWFKYEAANYSCVANDPFNKFDKDGNWPEWVSTVASVGAGIVAGIAVVAMLPAATTILGMVAVGALSGAIGGLVEGVVSELLKPGEFNLECVLKAALWGGLIGGLLGGIIGKFAGPIAAILGPRIAKLAPAIKRLIEKLTGKAVHETAKIASATDDVMKGLFGAHKYRIKPGNPEKVAVIGRNMGNDKVKGVKDIAKELEKKGVKSDIFDGPNVSKEAMKEFESATENFTKHLSDDELKSLKIFKENEVWAKKLSDEGYTVIDMGNPNGSSNSIFYEMEKISIFGD